MLIVLGEMVHWKPILLVIQKVVDVALEIELHYAIDFFCLAIYLGVEYE